MEQKEFVALQDEVRNLVRRCIRREREKGRRGRRVEVTLDALRTSMQEHIERVDKKDEESLQDIQEVYLGAFARLGKMEERPVPVFLMAKKFGKEMVALSAPRQSTGLTRQILEALVSERIPKKEVVATLHLMDDMACLTDHRKIACDALLNVFQSDSENSEVVDAVVPVLDRLSKQRLTPAIQETLLAIREKMVEAHPDREDFKAGLEKLKGRVHVKPHFAGNWRYEGRF